MFSQQNAIEALEGRRFLTASGFPFAIGSTGADSTASIASDRVNSVIVAGTLADAADIDPATSVVDLSAGTFVAKYASDGSLVFGRQFAGATINKVATDGSNSIYLAGSFSGTVDFDPRRGVHNVTSAGGTDAFVLKLSKSGNFVSVETFGGKGDDAAAGLAVDSAGNMFIGGTFKARANFDPNGVFSIGNSGGSDGFLVALDSTGVFRWAGSFGGSGDDTISDLAVDDSGNVIATGHYFGSVDFDPGHGTSSVNVANTQQAYILKWDSTGAFVFADGIGGTGVATGSAVTVDRSDNVYATGNFTETADFDPGAGTFNLTAPSTGQVYVNKLSASGSLVWAKAIGGAASQDVGPAEIAVDKGGNVYTSGIYSGTKDFDPNGGTSNLTSAGQDDVFVSKLNSSGNFVFAKSFGGTLDDAAIGLVLDRAGNILTTGTFSGTGTFATGGSPINLTSAGGDDIFVLRQDSGGLLS
jgi:hypothetical protein